jgi:uncharacterized protein YukE
MMRIRVDPVDLQELARQFSAASSALHRLEVRLSSSWSALDVGGWEGEHRRLVEAKWWEAQTQMNELTDQAEMFSTLLTGKAIRFEDADQASLTSVGHMFAALAGGREAWTGTLCPFRPGFDRAQGLTARLMVLQEVPEEIPTAPVFSLTGITGKSSGTRGLRSG